MKETIIVDLGIIPYQVVEGYVEKSPYEVAFIGKKSQLKQFENIKIENAIYDYDKIIDAPIEKHAYNALYSKIYSDITNDYRTQLIAERCAIRYGFRSNHNDMALINRMIENYLLFFERKNVKFVFYQACPHALYSWVFANVAEHLGIKVYLTFNSLFYWRNILIEGINKENIIEIGNEDVKDPIANKYLDAVNKKYEDAIPEPEKKRLAKRKKSLFSWREEIKAGVKDPKTLLFKPLKFKLYKNFLKYCKVPSLEEKYIILFMHYQPERTSLPEGRMFTNQLHIVYTLHRALPEGWKLYVKEHPATFTNSQDYDPRYRDLSFYKRIAELPNVTLVDLRVDSFSLIDNCQCLATITGTVGGEGLLRCKPVLTFGNAPYRNHKYVFDINCVEDVNNALSVIENIGKEDVKKETYGKYVPYILKNSFSGIDSDDVSLDDTFSDEVRNLSIGRCLGELLSK